MENVYSQNKQFPWSIFNVAENLKSLTPECRNSIILLTLYVGHTDGLFGGNLHATVQAEKDKLLALQSRHGEFMKASDFKHVMFFK